MRKIEFSGNTECATRLSSLAEARSRPNGFSTMTRAFLERFADYKHFLNKNAIRSPKGIVIEDLETLR